MSENGQNKPLDPREQMKAALAAKQVKSHKANDATLAHESSHGAKAGAKVPGKRQFRRKSGG